MPALRSYLRQHLNSYMIPSRLIPVDSLPRMASGKIDYRALTETVRDLVQAVAGDR